MRSRSETILTKLSKVEGNDIESQEKHSNKRLVQIY